jgi:hypothetical protein
MVDRRTYAPRSYFDLLNHEGQQDVNEDNKKSFSLFEGGSDSDSDFDEVNDGNGGIG